MKILIAEDEDDISLKRNCCLLYSRARGKRF